MWSMDWIPGGRWDMAGSSKFCLFTFDLGHSKRCSVLLALYSGVIPLKCKCITPECFGGTKWVADDGKQGSLTQGKSV